MLSSRSLVYLSSSRAPAVSTSVDALAQHAHRRIDFAAFALFGHDAKDFPNVFYRFEMVAAVAEDVHDAHDTPALELAKARAHVRACDGKSGGNLFGVERLGRNEEKGVDLRHGAIDAPAGAHFPPVEDELLRDGGESGHVRFSAFCHYRNYSNVGHLARDIFYVSNWLYKLELDYYPPLPSRIPGLSEEHARASPGGKQRRRAAALHREPPRTRQS